ncbi:hypothetical protein LF41_3028 [Lysobacter dokdonensis DS-58]|uniref:Uncharacterized protein n=1 Tax=Lysobacter dokdonensis DS-58 TaxID=1300345 RepID=A0A0A2WHT5_9GAMM|nr:hypothetical protein [Lysobacter dokdonensis]KGQ19378.1 hypothetical protein LF41_3028 [Lysobacter dokdonensis DS-58]
MQVHIEKMTSDVSVQTGELALTQAQCEKLVALVISKLEDRAREAMRARAATALTTQAAKPFEAGR